MGFSSTTSRVDLSFFNSMTLLLLLLAPLVRATCYQPNGNIDTSVVPCNITINSSACCAPTDSCTTSGLCLGASGYVYRSACTDLTWSSKNCPAICQNDPLTNAKTDNHLDLYPCQVGVFASLFACGSGSHNNTCAHNFTFAGTGLSFPPAQDAQSASLASFSSLAALATATGTQSPMTVTITATATVIASSAAQTSGSSSNSNSGVVATKSNLSVALGAGIGIPLGLAVIGFLSFLLWREKKNNSGRIEGMRRSGGNVEYYNEGWKGNPDQWINGPASTTASRNGMGGGGMGQEMGRAPVYQMGGQIEPHQLDGTGRVAEMRG